MSNARLHRYYLQQHAATEFIVACYINMGITAFAFRNYESIPFFGESSIVVDMLSTGLILPIIVGLIAVARVRKHIRAGELPPLNAAQPGPFIARILPSSLWLRAVVFAIYGVLAAMLALIALRMLNIDAVPYWPFVIFVGAFCGVLAAYIAAISGYRVIIGDDHAAIVRGEVARRRKA